MTPARFIILLGLLAANIAQADAGNGVVYYERHSEGWFWYEDPEPEPDKEAHEVRPQLPTDPVEALASFQKEIETAKARAILEPTNENLKSYLRLNQLAMNRAGDFAQAWQRAVWTTPALDTRLTNPVNDQAVQVFNDEKLQLVDEFLVRTAQSHGLFFFFKGSCPYCHRFAPVLKAFAENYGFNIIPVSLDGGTLPDFPNPRSSTEVAVKLEVDTVPALFLVNPRERSIHPVAFGYVSWTELRERIYTLLNDRPPNPLMQAQNSGDRIDANE